MTVIRLTDNFVNEFINSLFLSLFQQKIIGMRIAIGSIKV